MCGIIGAVSKNEPVDSKWFTSARDSMIHRGPNDSGIWSSKDGKILLGHRRLSIIDLPNSSNSSFSPIVLIIEPILVTIRLLLQQ